MVSSTYTFYKDSGRRSSPDYELILYLLFSNRGSPVHRSGNQANLATVRRASRFERFDPCWVEHLKLAQLPQLRPSPSLHHPWFLDLNRQGWNVRGDLFKSAIRRFFEVPLFCKDSFYEKCHLFSLLNTRIHSLRFHRPDSKELRRCTSRLLQYLRTLGQIGYQG